MLCLTSSSCEAFVVFFKAEALRMRIQLRAVVVSFNVAGLHPNGDVEERPRDAKSLSIIPGRANEISGLINPCYNPGLVH